jgi:phage terminase large subunit
MLVADHAEAIKRRGEVNNSVSDHDAQERAELTKQRVRTSPAKKDVTLGIQKVSERLVKQKDGKPRLMFFNTCKNTISEISKYQWQERKEGRPVKEEPLKIDDHAMDALRYMVMELDYNSRPKIEVPIFR